MQIKTEGYVIFPSSFPREGEIFSLFAWKEYLEFWFPQYHWNLQPHPNCGKMSSWDETGQKIRLSWLMEALGKETVELVFAWRGGYGSQSLLPLIPKNPPRKNAPRLSGFSDFTALALALWHQWHWPSWYAPTLLRWVDWDPSRREKFMGTLTQGKIFWEGLPLVPLNLKACHQTSILRGTLLGGCLSVATSLLGTPYLPDFSGSIVLFEDVGESPERLWRFLTQWIQSQHFKNIQGIIWGSCHKDLSTDWLKAWADITEKPLWLAPFGHEGTHQYVWPLGERGIIKNHFLSLDGCM